MESTDQEKKIFNKFIWPALVFLTFAIFIFSLRKFFSGEYLLREDANVYYEHFKFYIDQIGKGVLPFWDPSRDAGVPTEFYLRRMGSDNPLYLLILALVKIGIPHEQAYFSFLAFYFFLGMAGFYKLSQRLFKDNFWAFIAFLSLTYSSWFALLFNSFIVLIFTPMAWFFFFLMGFFQKSDKISLLGVSVCLSALLNTYIPFYFLFIFLVFLLSGVALYFKSVPVIAGGAIDFMSKHKLMTVCCVFLVLVSLIPGYLFYQEGQTGNFVLPTRHNLSATDNQLGVARQSTATGGVIALNFMNELFGDYRKVQLGAFYVPIFVHILFLLGIVVAIRRRLVLVSLVMFLVYLMSVYQAGPLYKFFYDHIFFFKYFRNFQFFLWLVIVPGYVLIGVDHLQAFWQEDFTRRKWVYAGFITLVHLGFGIFLFRNGNHLVLTYVTIVLSLLFFLLRIFGVFGTQPRQDSRRKLLPLLLLAIVIVISQPLQNHLFLAQNATRQAGPYRYDQTYDQFTYLKDAAPPRSEEGRIYYATKWYYLLYSEMLPSAFDSYLLSSFYLYDNVEYVEESTPKGIARLQESFAKKENTAFVSSKDEANWLKGKLNSPQKSDQVLSPSADSENFKIISYNVNGISLKTNFSEPKFLVYSDNYYPGWKVFVGGQRSRLYRANAAFKGVYIPAGTYIVQFIFQPKLNYALKVAAQGLFLVAFISLIFLVIRKELKRDQDEGRI